MRIFELRNEKFLLETGIHGSKSFDRTESDQKNQGPEPVKSLTWTSRDRKIMDRTRTKQFKMSERFALIRNGRFYENRHYDLEGYKQYRMNTV